MSLVTRINGELSNACIACSIIVSGVRLHGLIAKSGSKFDGYAACNTRLLERTDPC
jgi:hypothetical protein